SGQVPWAPRGDPLALVGAILTAEPLPLTGVPSPLDRIVRRALAKSPDDRFATMGEVVKALEGSDGPHASAAGAGTTPATIDRRKYSEAEIEQILERALEQEAPDDRLSLRELRDAAREIGIADASLESAAREVERRRREAGDDESPGEARGRKV